MHPSQIAHIGIIGGAHTSSRKLHIKESTEGGAGTI